LRCWRWSLLFPEKEEEERAEQGKTDQRPNYSTSDPGLRFLARWSRRR
jgi:hypothetical protein